MSPRPRCPLQPPLVRSRLALYLDLILELPCRLAAAAVAHAQRTVDRRRQHRAGTCWLVFVAGTILMRSAGCCVNDVPDRDFDRHVKRTGAAGPSPRAPCVGEAQALRLGALLALVAFALVLTTNRRPSCCRSWRWPSRCCTPSPSAWCPCRRRCWAWPSASGIPMAFAATQGGTWVVVSHPASVPLQAWGCCWATCSGCWPTTPRKYAMVDRDDDLRIGMKTSAITLGRFDVAAAVWVRGAACRPPGLAGDGTWGWSGWYLAGRGRRRGAQALWHFTLIRAARAKAASRPSG